MTDKTIDVLLNVKHKGVNETVAGSKRVEKSLKDIETQANRTRERMQKLQMVGRSLALTGGAILAPFAIAMKRYVDATKETEPTSRKILELSKRWEQSQVKIGRVTAEIVLPALEKALDVIDKITAFAEKNPGAIKAALGIGGTLVVLGGLISGAASIVQTLATVQGLAAGLGIGGSAAGGTSALLAGLGPVLMAVMTNPLTWAVLALLLVKPILNALLGTNQTWEDIATTGKQALFLVGYGIDKVIRSVGSFFSNMGNSIVSALQKAATFMVEGIGGGIARLLGLAPHKAMGGYMPTGLYNVSEGGKREFALSHSTTRAAEQVIGGSLSQGRLLAALAGGGGKRITYQDHRRIDASLSMSQRRAISNDVMSALTGAI